MGAYFDSLTSGQSYRNCHKRYKSAEAQVGEVIEMTIKDPNP